MMLQPAVDELLEVAVAGEDLEISAVKVSQVPAVKGRTRKDLDLPAKTSLMVVAVVQHNGQRQFIPPPTFKPMDKDRLVIFGLVGGVDRMMSLFGKSR